ncbi:MAG TPA: hypothetical protein VKO86_15995 [Gemmatimonadales bacterium]|nr:hypothetical protein [Gemmatimonadales bacterium]
MSDGTGTAAMRDVVVVGGGCYGTFYASQLARAKARGKATFRSVVIVDRDPGCRARRELPEAADRVFVTSEWDAFFDRHLAAARPGTDGDPPDYVVPSPHMSHLMFEWLVRRTRARCPNRTVDVVPVPDSLGTPYDRTGPDNTRYVSFADWICPTHCIEPALCPAIGAPRTWEMPEAVGALAGRLRAGGAAIAGPVLFICRHHVYGVGTFAVDAVLEGERVVAQAAAARETAHVLVGTVSSCHGALNLLRIGASPADS